MPKETFFTSAARRVRGKTEPTIVVLIVVVVLVACAALLLVVAGSAVLFLQGSSRDEARFESGPSTAHDHSSPFSLPPGADAPATSTLPGAPSRPHSSPLACTENLAKLDGALEQWALENNKTTGTTQTISGLVAARYFKRTPVCPQGGKYPAILTVGTDPTCTLGSGDKTHRLPSAP